MLISFFFFESYGDHRDLHVRTHSFPTRRSSVLLAGPFDPASDRELNIARNPRPRLAELDCRNARKRNALIALEAVIERTIGDGDGVIVDRDRFGLPFQRLPDDCVDRKSTRLNSSH